MTTGLRQSEAFSGLAARDIDEAKTFYADTLGLNVVTNDMGMLTIVLPSGREILVYPNPAMTPASYTVLNFPVPDVEATVDDLVGRGVEFQKYNGMVQDAKGIMRAHGPVIAWFADPSGNVLSVIEE